MSTFDRRRVLSRQQELMAVGAGLAAGLGVGVVVFYLARLRLQRQPMLPSEAPVPGAPVAGTPAAPAGGGGVAVPGKGTGHG